MYILLTEKNGNKTVVRDAKFENRNLVCMESTSVMHNVRVMCIIYYIILSCTYIKNTVSYRLAELQLPQDMPENAGFRCDKAAVLRDKIK